MPALFMRQSSRVDLEVNCLAAAEMEVKEDRSSGRNVILASGWIFFSSVIAASPLLGLRAARKISEGLCADNCFMVSHPKPVLPNLERLSEYA